MSMPKRSLHLSTNTIKIIAAIAQEHDATFNEVAQYLFAKGLAQYGNATEELPAVPPASLKQAEL